MPSSGSLLRLGDRQPRLLITAWMATAERALEVKGFDGGKRSALKEIGVNGS